MPSRPKSKRSTPLPVVIKDHKQVATRPVMLLVLGPHRSGTSLTARMLECLGAENSRNLNPPNFANPTGYFEDSDIYQFNDNILLPKLQQSWASVSSPDYTRLSKAERSRLGLQALGILRRNYSLANPLSVLKEPRINNTLPFWLSLLEHMGFDVRIVCVVRDPVSTARSLAQRDNFSLAHGGMIYLSAWLSMLPHLQERQVSFVQFDEIFATPGKVLARVADKLGLPLPPDFDQRVHAFTSAHLDPSLRHSSLPREDVMLEPDLPPLVAELYRVLLDAAQSQNVRKTAKFAAYAERQIESLAPLLADYDAKQTRLASIQTESNAAKAECARLQSQLTDSSHQSHAVITTERDAVVAERETLRSRISALEAEHSELASRHQHLATVLEDLKGQHTSVLTERDSLAQERELIRSERDTLAQERSNLIVERDALATRYQQLATALESLQGQHSSLSTIHSSLVAERDDLATRHASLVTAFEELQDEHSSLAAAQQALTLQKAQVTEHAAELELIRNHTAAERDAIKNKLAAFQTERDGLAARISTLEAEHSDLVTRHTSLVTEREALKSAHYFLSTLHSSLVAERDELATRHSSLAAALEELQGQHSLLVAERDALAARVSSLQSEHADLAARHSSLATALDALEEKHATVVAERDAVMQELSTLKDEHERLSLKHAVFMDDFGKAAEELAFQQEQMERNKAELTTKCSTLEHELGEVRKSSSQSEALAQRIQDLESKLRLTEISCNDLSTQRDALQGSLNRRFEELADLAREISRQQRQLETADRRCRFTDGSVVSVGDIQLRDVHNAGDHKHIAFDCYNVRTPLLSLPKVSVRVVRHFDKIGIAIFRDHNQGSSVLRDWVTSGKENGAPYMLLVLDDLPAQQWLAKACASDFQTILLLAEICMLSLAKQQTKADGSLNCESSHSMWLPVAQTLVSRLASLSRVLRFDSVAVQQHIKDRGSREDFELSGVSFAGGYARNLRFSVTRQGLRSKLSIPSEQPGSVFWSSGDSPLELTLTARLSTSGIAWTPKPSQNPGSLRACWGLALADNLPKLRAFSAGEKP